VSFLGSSPAAASQPTPDSAGTVWLCRPGQAHDPCTASLSTTVIDSDGSTHVVDDKPAVSPPVDCFYLYPNITVQRSANANLHIDPQETAIAELEASPFSQDCRVYAPMYREATGGDPSAASLRITERSVRKAWADYLSHYNDGRGVVLIGHSAGSAQIAADILTDPTDPSLATRNLLVSAILTGLDLPVLTGAPGVGAFKGIGPCTSVTQTGCVVDFNAFSEPPPSDTKFGKFVPSEIDGRAVESMCTNPSNLAGGSGALISMYRTHLPTQDVAGSSSQGILMHHPPAVSTPWVEYDGQYTGKCTTSNGAHVLIVHGAKNAPSLTPFPEPKWGLHVDDPNLAMGNLVALVRSEAASYVAARAATTPTS
jgi:hypothetical protein